MSRKTSTRRTSSIREFGCADLDDLRIDNAFLEPEKVSASEPPPQEATQRKSASKTTGVLPVISILLIITVGALLLAALVIGLRLHEHGEIKMFQELVLEQSELVIHLETTLLSNVERINQLAEDLEASEGRIHQHGETIGVLNDELELNAQRVNELQDDLMLLRSKVEVLEEDKCLADYKDNIYANGTCYFAVESTATWDGANEKCKTMKGTLASPYTEDQWQAVYHLSRSGSFWIGFRQSASDDSWMDMAGRNATRNVLKKWHGEDGVSEDCAYTYKSWSWPNFVGDLPCSEERRFICGK